MTPDFDPARVDWNNPDVEYLMKHFKTAMTSWNDEIAALTRSNEELRGRTANLRQNTRISSECTAKSPAGTEQSIPTPRQAPGAAKGKTRQGGAATTCESTAGTPAPSHPRPRTRFPLRPGGQQ